MRSAAEFRAPRGIPYHTRYATRSAPKTRQSALETPDATALYRGDWPGPVADLQTYSTNCALSSIWLQLSSDPFAERDKLEDLP
jgi:hypothetical protein